MQTLGADAFKVSRVADMGVYPGVNMYIFTGCYIYVSIEWVIMITYIFIDIIRYI